MSLHKLRPPHRKLKYSFSSGPLTINELKSNNFSELNCRLAVQYYLYALHNIYLAPHEILLPRSYLKTGRFISNHYTLQPNLYQPGDIIFAYRRTIPQDRRQLINIHTAVFTTNNKIYHSTSIIGRDTIWSMKTFSKYYEIFAVKRVIK